ncbi:unnamed protein product [Sordaria macrospora k-hell]|uniref:WGS project CABT00000000 data, contig 2.17 n=1 Tax=Sordaria macrospora (strain ATCC MYA-333 / DSM 997 / K(L3346) / K-hell) TaxID=771870 RepID=F7W0H9_SORMK|nr:uncharacterized protein SMAC_03982 [Sordaria macrospora k-hell]CCC11279.1 unnamed protein product [Sordaria macrospora k-hell]
MAAANNPFGAPPAPAANPFAKPIQAAQPAQTASVFGSSSAPNQSPFGKPIFGQAQSTAPSASPSPFAQNPFAKPGQTNSAGGNQSPFFGAQTTTQQSTGFGAANANAIKAPQGFGGGKPSGPSNGFGNSQASQMFGKGKATPQQPQQSGGRDAGATLANKFQRGQRKNSERPAKTQPSATRAVGSKSTSGAPTREPTERTRELSEFAFNFHNKINDQLKKDNLKPPQWPTPQLGNPNKRDDVENLKQSFKKYRSRVYDALRKVELIDDPEKRRKLEDALPFKGICEDMCPEFEKISRIAEFDVKTEEKETQPGGLTAWPEPSKMVKKFGRSAAGQDAPLPMDVRSIDALRRTTDYLFNDLLQSENNLPSMHNYLWDRTRAVRKDFTFHSQKSAEEMKDMVYCFETITRFHATALHLLSRKGFANDDFEQKQEIEQLGRTILSLMEAYDVCKEKHVLCENEAEFRAYYLLLNAHEPSIAQRIRMWGKEYWFDSEEIQTALSLIHVMEDLRQPKGPIKPRRMTTMSDTAFTNFFAIVENPRVSYTMACVAEVHFTFVRQCILKNLVRAYARHRDAPRTITASDLNKMLRFDTPEEAVAFAEEHNFEFTTWVPPGKPAVPEPYLLINDKKKHVPSPRVPQSYSGLLVERKRAGQSLPHVIYNTIYEDAAENSSPGKDSDANGGGLFVNPQQALPAFPNSQVNKTQGAASSPFTSMFGAAPPVTKAPEKTPMFQTAVKDFGALNHLPTESTTTNSPQATGAMTSSPFSRPSPAQQPQEAASPFSMFGQPSAAPPSTQTPSSAPAPKPTSVFGQAPQTSQPTFSFGHPQAANPSSIFSAPTAPAAGTSKPITWNTPAPATSVFSSGSAPANPSASLLNQNMSTVPAKSSETTQQPSSGFTFAPAASSPKPPLSFTQQQKQSTTTGQYPGGAYANPIARNAFEAGFELKGASSTASRRRDARSLRGSMAGSPESTASKEGGKTRALREKFGLGGPRGSFSSVGGSSVQSSMINKFRHSLSGIGVNGENSMIKRASNFSTPRKRSIEPSPATEGRNPKQPRRSLLGMSMANTSLPNISLRQGTNADSPKPNGFKTSHWDLRARGLVPMPDGQWLPEAIASAIKEGKLKPPSPPTRNHSYSPAVRPSTEHAILSDDDESMGMGSTYDNGDDVEVDDSASMTSWRLRVARLTGSTNPVQQHLQTPKQPPADYSTSSRLAKLKARLGYGSPSASGGQGSPAIRKRVDLASEAEEASSVAQGRGQGRPENSPPLAKKAYYAASAVSRGSTTALSTREETNAVVEETQRMLKELRETMDKLDTDKAAWREEVGGGKS